MCSQRRPAPPPTYLERLRAELEDLHRQYDEVLDASAIHNVDPNRGGSYGMVFIGFVEWDWVASDGDLERDRVALLGRMRSWDVRFRLLFTNPVPTVANRIDDNLGLLERWLVRDGRGPQRPDHLSPGRTRCPRDPA